LLFILTTKYIEKAQAQYKACLSLRKML